MTTLNELVLQSEITPDRTLKTVSLYSEENALGSERQRIREGEISIGSPVINQIQLEESEGELSRWNYYTIDIPFTLHRLDEQRHYDLVVFQITLGEASSIARDIFPREVVTAETKIKKSLSISSDLKFSFQPIETSFGSKEEDSLEYIVLKPLLTPFGKGERQFYWEYKKFNEQSVLPGVKQAAFILQTPMELEAINVHFDYEADVSEKLFGVITKKKTKTDRFTESWLLPKSRN